MANNIGISRSQIVTGGGSGSSLWSSLKNAAANLTLSNAAFTTTFDQTSAAVWLWANTTAGTALTVNASPLHEFAANYYTGSASAQDTWTIGSSLAAGTNGASTLTIAHTGSTGRAAVIVPAGSYGVNGAFGLTFTGTNVGFTSTGPNIW